MNPNESPVLERQLGLRDLVLFNLVAILGISWVATAAKAGPGSLTLWLLAAALFFVPQGLAVIHLAADMPEEGGIYAWTRKELGEAHGFICGWCYWINNVLYYPSLLLAAAVTATFVIRQGETGLADNWTYVLPFTLIGLVIAVGLNVAGVGTGKWLQNIGGLGVFLPGALLVGFGLYRIATGVPANTITLSELKPDLGNLPKLNLWATIAFAFAGLELSSTMASEIKDAPRSLPRSIFVTAPIIALIYIIGTCSMLWLVPRGQINVVAGPLQAISNGAGPFGWWLVSLVALLLTVARIGGVGAWLVGSSRVAFVVGLDRYFPAAFGRIHPRWRTPYVAILVQGVIAGVFMLLSVLGKGTTVEAAFLILIDMSLLIYFVPYLYLFVCFMVHCWRERSATMVVPGGKAGAVVAGLCGFGITLFAMVVALFPPPGTTNIWLHETKLGGGSLFLLGVGLVIYWRARRKNPRPKFDPLA
ncbi:MAG: APC family permease [Chthoniobacterales bacterium]